MAKGFHHVTQNIRSQIYAFLESGWSLRKIASYLGLNVSTISASDSPCQRKAKREIES